MRGAFVTARNEEYAEIIDKCEDFLRQVQKEYDENHFTYAELEENEEDLVKLKNWFAKIVDRDVFRRRPAAGHRAGARNLRAVARGVRRAGVRRGGRRSVTRLDCNSR